MSIILFFLILTVLVFVHELGHFLVAKRSGIRVDEFGFGFPPRLWGIQRGETKYSINLIPFGGFVKIFGENPDEASLNGPDKNRSFINKPKYIQALVLVAGVAFNFIFAWLLLSVGFISGLPSSVGSVPNANVENASLVITSVMPESPAADAGLKVGDKILQLSDGETLSNPNPESLQEYVVKHPNKEITVSYSRAGEEKTAAMTPENGLIGDKPAIGISMDMIGTLKLPVHKALWHGLKLTTHLTKQTANSLWTLIKGAVVGQADLSAVTGPVGIVGVVGDAYQFGWVYLLSFAAIISINLAIINLIPFPALDGGRLLFVLIESIKGSPIKPKIANTLNSIGFILLILLMLVVTYHDIVKLIK